MRFKNRNLVVSTFQHSNAANISKLATNTEGNQILYVWVYMYVCMFVYTWAFVQLVHVPLAVAYTIHTFTRKCI